MEVSSGRYSHRATIPGTVNSLSPRCSVRSCKDPLVSGTLRSGYTNVCSPVSVRELLLRYRCCSGLGRWDSKHSQRSITSSSCSSAPVRLRVVSARGRLLHSDRNPSELNRFPPRYSSCSSGWGRIPMARADIPSSEIELEPRWRERSGEWDW